MPKRKHLILFTVVIAIAALFAATEVMAFCTNCDPLDPPYVYDGTSVYEDVLVGGWTIQFLGVEIVKEGCTGVVPGSSETCDFSDSECFKWHYKIFETSSGTASGRNSFSMMIPDCCPGPPFPCTGNYVYVDVDGSIPGNLTVYGVTGGEPSVGFGQYNESGYVIRGTPDRSASLSILTNTNTAAVLPGILKVKKAGVLSFEITGPGCPSSPRSGIGAFATQRCLPVAEVTDGPVYLNAPFERGCFVDDSAVAFIFDDPTCKGNPISPYFVAESAPEVKYCGGLEPGCPQCVRVRTIDQYTCIQYTAETLSGNKRFQQCILSNGTSCPWNTGSVTTPDGCAKVFAE